MKKRILINLLLIFVLLGIAEFVSFLLVQNENYKFSLSAGKAFKNFKHETKYELMTDFNPQINRNSFIIDNAEKNPVLWFGCSFAAGANLSDSQSPCRKLAKLSGRSCINRSKNATGAQFVYYQFDELNMKEIAPDVDFVIYTFIYDHIFRLYNVQANTLLPVFNLRYKISNGYPSRINPVFRPLYSSFLVKRILKFISVKKSKIELQKYTLFNRLMTGTLKRIRSTYPNAVFIIIRFPSLTENPFFDENFQSEIKTLKSYGIEVFDVNKVLEKKGIDYTDEKYWTEDKIHPNEKIWDIILPEIVNKYSM